MSAILARQHALLSKFSPVFRSGNKLLSISCGRMGKRIEHTEEGNKIVVEGIKIQDQNTSKVMAPACKSGQTTCHPFCRSPIVSQVKHTDVLILDQFVDSKGEMYSQEELEICGVSTFILISQ